MPAIPLSTNEVIELQVRLKCEQFREVVNKLVYENKKLKEQTEYYQLLISKACVKLDCADDTYLLVDEIEKLKEELQQEKDGRDHDVKQFQETLEENGSLEGQVEELKEEVEELKKDPQLVSAYGG